MCVCVSLGLLSQFNADHIAYTMSMMTPLFHARLLNETGRLTTPLPTLGPHDIVSLVADPWVLAREFTRSFIDFSVGNKSRVELCKHSCHVLHARRAFQKSTLSLPSVCRTLRSRVSLDPRS